MYHLGLHDRTRPLMSTFDHLDILMPLLNLLCYPRNLNYKDASRLMYGKLLPTEHHLNLLNVSVSFA